jgi:hypothetical protein
MRKFSLEPLKPLPSQYMFVEARRIETSTEATSLESLAVPQMPVSGEQPSFQLADL